MKRKSRVEILHHEKFNAFTVSLSVPNPKVKVTQNSDAKISHHIFLFYKQGIVPHTAYLLANKNLII